MALSSCNASSNCIYIYVCLSGSHMYICTYLCIYTYTTQFFSRCFERDGLSFVCWRWSSFRTNAGRKVRGSRKAEGRPICIKWIHQPVVVV